MSDRKYSIHQADGVEWRLIFDRKAGTWMVEEVRGPRSRTRVTLNQFEATDMGRKLAPEIRAAVKKAGGDL